MIYKHLISIFVLYNLCIALFSTELGNNQTYKVLEELDIKTKKICSIQSRFIQKKKISFFTKELSIEGMIYIKKPNLFAWHVYKPVRYGLVIKDSVISQWNEDTDTVKNISMNNNPAFKAIFSQMNNWLSGNYKSLLNDYRVSVISEEPLSLSFAPLKSAASSDLVTNIIIKFNEDLRYLNKITIVEKNGDKTTLSFIDTKLDKQIPVTAWSAKF